MWIIGLTGAIGAGKSTLAKYIRHQGIPVLCADQEVHSLLKKDSEVIQKVKDLWPHVFIKGEVDRNLLGKQVFLSPSSLDQLESLLYPKLLERQKRFLIKNNNLNVPLVVLDVPLLMEVGLDSYCHSIILALTSLALRKQRALRRKGMTLEKFLAIESRQMNDEERKKRADIVIPCGREKESSLKMLQEFLNSLMNQESPSWDGTWPAYLKRETYGKGSCP